MGSKMLKKTDVSSDSGVIQFPGSNRMHGLSKNTTESWIDQYQGHQSDIDSMKQFLENTIREATIMAQIELKSQEDNPFDAIYIAKLLPDHIQEGAIDQIHSYSHIEDLSQEIEFDDGWDD